MTIFSLALDFVLIGLLGTMIFFAVRLHKRLEVLRSGKQDLETLLRDLVANTATAERNLKQLQVMAEELAPSLQKQVAGARAAREELEFLLGSADVAADRLMTQIGASKTDNGNIGTVRSEPQPSAPKPVINHERATPTLQAVPQSDLKHQNSPDETRRAADTDLLRAIEKLR